MKTFFILLVCLTAAGVTGQAVPVNQEFNVAPPGFAKQSDLFKPTQEPNQIAGPRPDITYSGIIPEVIKADNPLELINPFAPEEFGYGEQNLSLDVTARHAAGLKIFSIDF